MNVTGSSIVEVTGGGQGVVSHAGLALLRHLGSIKTGLAGGLSRALASARILVHERRDGYLATGVRRSPMVPG